MAALFAHHEHFQRLEVLGPHAFVPVPLPEIHDDGGDEANQTRVPTQASRGVPIQLEGEGVVVLLGHAAGQEPGLAHGGDLEQRAREDQDAMRGKGLQAIEHGPALGLAAGTVACPGMRSPVPGGEVPVQIHAPGIRPGPAGGPVRVELGYHHHPSPLQQGGMVIQVGHELPEQSGGSLGVAVKAGEENRSVRAVSVDMRVNGPPLLAPADDLEITLETCDRRLEIRGYG